MPNGTQPAWLTTGLKDLGFHEIGNNQGIEKFIKQAHCGSLGDPWCACLSARCLCSAARTSAGGRKRSAALGTRSASSQSFRRDDNFIKLDAPSLGAIVVYTRGAPSSGLGHVGFYMGETDTQVLTLGGNESDALLHDDHDNDGGAQGEAGRLLLA